MTLCRHYVRELRRSVLIGTPDPEHASRRSSQILESMGEIRHGDPGPSMYATEKERDQDAQMSAYLREDRANPPGTPGTPGGGFHDSPHSSAERARPSHHSSNTPRDLVTDETSPLHAVARQDIRASAEKILYTFLLPGAEREIVLPHYITEDVTRAIEEEGRDDPEVFDLAKDYVFQAMERDAFPGFLRMKALGNLIPPTLILRLIVGLVSMFGGFWAAFVLIFLDKSRLTRLWVCCTAGSDSLHPQHLTDVRSRAQLILPFTLGVYFLASYQYSLDPLLALIGLSEYTPFNFSRVREPYVRKLLAKRALMVLAVTAFIDAAILVLFILVPGKRL